MKKEISSVLEPAAYILVFGSKNGSFSLLDIFALTQVFLLHFYLSHLAFPCPGSDLPVDGASPSLLFTHCVSFGWQALKAFVSSNTDFASRILFPQAVALDFDNPFLSPRYEMALIQNSAHSHVQD